MSQHVAAALEARLQAAWPHERWRDVTVIVAVSGGADSVALSRGLCALRAGGEGRVVLAHFNHRLRGAESDADEAFVRALAEQLGLRCVVGQATSDLAAAGGDGIEAAARDARYAFLAKAAGECGARYLATAHTADDQVETVLFNVLRGTGLAGLAGIPRLRPLTDATTIIRPLLDVTRAEVLAYLASLGQPFRDDETNQRTDYTRNRIRLQLLPQLEREYNPRVREAIQRISQAAGQADGYIEQQAETALATAVRRIAGGVEFHLKRIAHLHPTIIRHTLMLVWREQKWPLQDMSMEKWDSLVALVQSSMDAAKSLQQDFPGFVRAIRSDGTLRLTLTRRD